MAILAKLIAVILITAFVLGITFFVPYVHLIYSCGG